MLKISKNSIYEFRPVPYLKVALERCLSMLRRELSSCLYKRRPGLFISPPLLFLLCRFPRCSQRCVTYGKQWISQYTVCLWNMFWLTFHWSRFSLWLPVKIVAAFFGHSPVWIYGGVSLSEDCWLVWVAAAYRPLISAPRFLQVLILCPWNWGKEGERKCLTSSRMASSGPLQGTLGLQHQVLIWSSWADI